MNLDDPKIERFLATKDVVVLATVQADGSPLAMPMWFLHDPAELTMISVAATQKVRNLRRDPRVCVVAEGVAKVAQKVGEEAVEAVIAAMADDRPGLVGEAADLLFHLLVLLDAKGVPLAEVLAELDRREGMSGIAEKASRSQ